MTVESGLLGFALLNPTYALNRPFPAESSPLARSTPSPYGRGLG